MTDRARALAEKHEKKETRFPPRQPIIRYVPSPPSNRLRHLKRKCGGLGHLGSHGFIAHVRHCGRVRFRSKHGPSSFIEYIETACLRVGVVPPENRSSGFLRNQYPATRCSELPPLLPSRFNWRHTLQAAYISELVFHTRRISGRGSASRRDPADLRFAFPSLLVFVVGGWGDRQLRGNQLDPELPTRRLDRSYGALFASGPSLSYRTPPSIWLVAFFGMKRAVAGVLVILGDTKDSGR